LRAKAGAPRKSLPDLSRSLIVREGTRALIAFALYLALYPAWKAVGGHDLYEGIVVMIANSVVLATQHFPIYSSITNLKMKYLDFLPILVLSCFLVSTRFGCIKRLRRFGALLLVILALHIVGFILETKIDTAQQLLRDEELLLLLPWEFHIIDGFKYLLVDFGLNIGPFVVLLLTFSWNVGIGLFSRSELTTAHHDSGEKTSARSPRRGSASSLWTPMRATVSMILMLGVGASAWTLLRESDPRHVQMHARVGHLFLRSDQWAKAEAQYTIALKNGTTDGRAWLNVAVLQAKRGHTGEAIHLLQRGLQVVKDKNWRQKLQDTKQRLISGG